MRKNWLLLGIGLVVAVLAVAAVACDDDDDDDNGGGDGATTLSATLSEVDGNGVTGSATLTEADGTTEVVVTMEGLPEGPHANHLHHGTCDAQGEVHVTLEELQADADGDATATTSGFPSDPEDPGIDHFAAGHYAAVHEAGNDTVGAVISCGDVS
ncbi:MAG: hypothetical protein IIA23_06775 [Chloroflexi bacterium]|nr:hypothetical protein [Chloroflexota bacterium]